MPDIVEFLMRCPPFDAFDPDAVERLAEAVEVEFHPAGAIIFSKGAQAVEFLRVIRTGAVEVFDDGRVLDLMGPGEMFGHASMLSGLPTDFGTRAAEDTLTYRIPADAASDVLARPHGLRYVTRLLLEDRHHLGSGRAPDLARDQLRGPVSAAIRSAAVMCEPGTPVREAAQRMTAAGATALVVDLGDSVGILTDSDLRSRVVGGGLPVDSPVSAAMTAPAFTVPSDRPGSEVLLDMLDRGIRHFPVISATGRVVGVVEDHDLVAVESRSSFFLRRAVARATTVDELVETSSKLRPAVIAMTRGGMAAADVMPVFSVVADALTRRALDLVVEQAGEPPTRFTWLALGSQARREAVPSSDLDSAIVWFDKDDGEAEDPSIRPYLDGVATAVTEILVRCGFRPDEHRVSASDPIFVRSLSSWQRAARSFLEDPTQEKALVLVSVLVDSRAVWGPETEPLVAETFRLAPSRPRLLRLLAEFALSHKPPTGFLRGLVVEFSGEHRKRLDLKSGGVVPIADLARWAGMAAGVTCSSTTARLEAAGDAGTLSEFDALMLRDAFELVCQLRLEHQVTQLEAGTEPDDVVDPGELNPLTRSYLKEAFRAVASVQRHITNELTFSIK
ncbi:MAG: putative nucleotidyltransferase substrate binding domain-containing protein [Acidimicrobiales bacterium]